ncbi:hypothetical protein NLG97_g10668 [Lecanicillium saksenae]|uniref:Uncharacterized protein n=1 Tax=Lecanicillium saksenae TaxID=468837 RepID=A0ACC1QDY1_9HYPO|nr:hypothetical protein NLG97_g10668 [Lecanicillium saksenae]
MIGHVKHVKKCIDIGVDIICAQGGEVVATPGAKSPLTGGPIQVIAAGGIHNGQLLAASLMMGATGVWVGTRFILTDEAGAPKIHKEAVKNAGHDDNIRTIIFTGRPMRVHNNPYINTWETERQQEMKQLAAKGTIPYEADLDKFMDVMDSDDKAKKAAAAKSIGIDITKFSEDDDPIDAFRPLLMGKAAAVVNEQKSAKGVIDEFVNDAVAWMQRGNKMIAKL